MWILRHANSLLKYTAEKTESFGNLMKIEAILSGDQALLLFCAYLIIILKTI